jgi:hypothetical protein
VLGNHKLSAAERTHFKAFFEAAEVPPLSEAVVSRAVSPRQASKR